MNFPSEVAIPIVTYLLAGTWIVYSGLRRRQQCRNLFEVSSLDDATVGETACVSGEISHRSGTVTSPYRSKECALVLWDTARFQWSNGASWRPQVSGASTGDHELLIVTDAGHVPVTNLSGQNQTPTAIERAEPAATMLLPSHSGSDSDSQLSVQPELRKSSFEERFKPTEELPKKYRDHNQEFGVDRTTVEAYTEAGRLINKLERIGPVPAPPADTIRYRESPFHNGDEITVIGKKTEAGISCEATETHSFTPAVFSGTLSDYLSVYRQQYLLRVYGFPLVSLLIAVLFGYVSLAIASIVLVIGLFTILFVAGLVIYQFAHWIFSAYGQMGRLK
ncbi:MAG: hypothetical protein J07HQW2_00457 [Haloquadratum walsbyi J07HQW2]|uniref:Uncharacterized protein n=1 Tax=Haloquadratum walsbyi J07HQW2 TaxID=1238425 RepID=U1NBK4_9EURY|nr:MAG: hypothetical protein J07HQW2_00457 [Haloquadratum walsbyi J07HQW2]